MTHMLKVASSALALVLIAGCVGSGTYEAVDKPRQGYFFVGGRYVETDKGPLMERQMYVEYQFPAEVKQPYPIVMIHGAAQTGTNFTGTPDGRKGWAQFFVERGYAVYIVDQPARGRSAYADALGANVRFSASQLEQRFTAHEKFNLWPQANCTRSGRAKVRAKASAAIRCSTSSTRRRSSTSAAVSSPSSSIATPAQHSSTGSVRPSS